MDREEQRGGGGRAWEAELVHQQPEHHDGGEGRYEGRQPQGKLAEGMGRGAAQRAPAGEA